MTPLSNDEAQIGDTLIYLLRSEEQPINPQQRWHGTIKRISIDMGAHAQQRYYLVQSREYPDCDELIYPEQVVGFERPLKPSFEENESA